MHWKLKKGKLSCTFETTIDEHLLVKTMQLSYVLYNFFGLLDHRQEYGCFPCVRMCGNNFPMVEPKNVVFLRARSVVSYFA